ncbi:MAG: DUF389 domain-containing protein [Vicinamibacteria bacterium]|nr:DUF389 domain-containing protein [Vicinamibacteria bacterium]
MTDSPSASAPPVPGQLRRLLAARFSLLQDKAENAEIDASLRAGVELSGSTPWILMFAILIASIGLNVNSTAVIIGAMLVSPLMGPIMGVGYGVGIYDFPLIRKSLLNLGIAAVISLFTSAFYFLVSPLAEAQSELLARTTPTIWDVLIAMFGGLAGIIGATRKEKSNVIPGVAIATALMPPLCTAGYGLAKGNWRFFFGASYLFTINCVFIAFATVIIISLFKLPHHKFVDAQTENRVQRALFAVVIIAALPSLYLAHTLVGDEVFSANARRFVRREFKFEKTHMTEVQISPHEHQIELTLIGDPVSPETLNSIELRLPEAGLAGATLLVRQAGDNRIDLTSLKAGIVSDLFREGLRTSDLKDEEINRLRADLTRMAAARAQSKEIALELEAQYPQFEEIMVGEGVIAKSETKSSEPPPAGASPTIGERQPMGERSVLVVSAKSDKALEPADRERIESWLKIRAKSEDVRLVVQVTPKTPVKKPPVGRAPVRKKK